MVSCGRPILGAAWKNDSYHPITITITITSPLSGMALRGKPMTMKSSDQVGEHTRTLDERVAINQMLLFCKQKQIVIAMAVAFPLILSFLWWYAPLSHVLLLLCLAAVAIVARSRAISKFPKLSPFEVDIPAWQKRFVYLALSSGFLFVVMEVIGYLALNDERWGFLDITVISSCGIGLGSMTFIPGLYPYFALPPLLVMAVFHAVAGGGYNYFMAFGTVLAAVSYLATSRYIGRSFDQSLRLRLQNEILTAEAEQQHRKLADILDSLPDPTFVIDDQGVVTAWNRAAEQTTGVKAAEIVGKGNYEYSVAFYQERRPVLIDLFSEGDRELEKKYGQFNRRGDTLSGEGYIPARGLWFEASASPLRNARGKVVGGIETVRDITDRKNIQIELEASQHQLANIIDSLPTAAFVIDEHGVITAWNRAAERMTGARAIDMIGKGNREYSVAFYGERRPIMIDFLFSRDRQAEERYQLLHLGDDIISGDAYIRPPAARELWIQAYATLLHDAKGKVAGAIETIRDISVHKQLEDELQASEQQLAQIIDLLPEAAFVINREGVVTAWNRAAEQMTGVSGAEIIGRGNYEYTMAFYGERRPILIDLVFLPEQELLQESYSHIRRVGDTLFAESQVPLRNGRIAWLQGSAGLLRDADGTITGAIEVVLDLTERKQFEDDLAAAREAAERASQAKADFLANMSHEIRTPMNAIIGMSYLTLQTELSPKQHNYVQKIHRAADHLLGIINEILDLSKIEAGKLLMEKVDFQLEDVMENLANLLGIRAEDKGLELLFDIAPEIPTALIGDPLRLGQIMVNLGNNAVKFTEHGEVVVGVESVAVAGQEAELHFWVRDSGIGMTQEQQGNLFQSFSQADTSTTRKYGGTGLGLVISKNLVEQMNGRIWVESEYGRGSTFHFHARFGLQAEQAPRRMIRADELAGTRVLIADDNGVAREILATMCRANGMEVDLGLDGRQALEMIEMAASQKSPYALVLMDWKMPAIDGVECIRRMREAGLDHESKVIMVTGYEKEDVLNSAEKRGVPLGTVLTKPVLASTLLEAIGETLGKALVHRSRTAGRALQQSEAMRRLRGARLLLVEDNEMNQELALELLKNCGIEVVLATNGQEALDVLNADSRFDGVLMDCQMPVMDGYTATRRIRSNPMWDRLPIIAMTANVIAGERDKVLSVGMCDHIGKPLDITAMFDTMARWIVPANPAAVPTAGTPPLETVSEALPELPGIDTAAGLATTMNNPSLYRRLLTKFRESQANFAEAFELARRDADATAAARAAHTLKGTAGNIGAKKVQQAAAQLEHACRDKAPAAEIERLLAATIKALQPVIDGLASLETDTGAGNTGGIDPEALQPLLARLLALLENDDLAAGDAVEELLAATKGTLLAEGVGRVAQAVAGFDVDAAIAALRKVHEAMEREGANS